MAEQSLEEVLAENLRRRRLELKMTQGDVGKRAGFATSYISMIEKGNRVPPLETIHALAKVLRCTAGDLMRPPQRRKGT